MDVLLISKGFLLGLICYSYVVSNKITEVWQNVAVYDDQDFTVYTLRTFPGESAAVCGNMCTKDSRCLSFTWNKLKLMCKMFSKIFYTIAQSKSIGNRYFKRKDYCIYKGYIQTPTLPVIPVCFQFFQSTPLDSISASSECEESKATLLRIINVDTILYIAAYLRSINVGTDVFIDGNDTAVEFKWKYSDGSDVIYLKWAPYEPSSFICNYCVERCLTLQDYPGVDFEGMNNMKCGDRRPYICQLHIFA
ncbi:Hypothetical predicted protein [Mytilus galloprovincialis]|uniref:C-type lectin domain-containing protein n=1 Tax=Mytilus galloprovincialis TaxID=29158 RepID=A0A8B6G684_MYTGA|nr:Hypothetical predicted protein [Mytilus galloprovincialis]